MNETFLKQLLEEREKSFAEANARFQVLFQNSPISIQILDPDGSTKMVNPAWQKLWDVSDEMVKDYILKSFNVFEVPQLHEMGVLPVFRRAFAGEFIRLGPMPFVPSELGVAGRTRVTCSNFCPIKYPDGRVKELMIFQEDITEQSEAVENKQFVANLATILLESLDYDKTLEHVSVATIPFFADGCGVDIIEHGEIKRLVTKHRDPAIEGLITQLAVKFVPTINSPTPTSRVIRSGEPHLLAEVDMDVITKYTISKEHAELVRETKLRSHLAVPMKLRGETVGVLNFWINSERQPFNHNDVQVAMEVARIASLAIDNAKYYREAQAAITQREDFISIASHELKTPVTALMLQMEIIQSVVQDQAPLDVATLRKISASANRQLDRLSKLIEDMLDLTRVSHRKLISEMKENVDLKLLVQQVILRFTEQLESQKIPLSFTCKEGIFVSCDPVRMEQVLTNLVSNAILYGLGNPISLNLSMTQGTAVFKIQDGGIGIAPSDHKRIFEQFERGHHATDGRGLGLGLFISRQIMEEQGGSIRVESAIGKGSTFIFELPLS